MISFIYEIGQKTRYELQIKKNLREVNIRANVI